MELKCVVLVTLVSLGAATPHGYGVKGGSFARAESSASSGVIGGVGNFPAAVPLGASFAGSYSKSSSSSHSSSSASSSASSFSYSGSGAGSYSGFGSNGISGCETGNCKNAPNGLSGTHGVNAGTQGYSAANSASSAGSLVGSPGCQGSDCQIDTNKCITGECKPKTDTDYTSIDSAANGKTGCTSGQCGLTHNSGVSSANYDADDIHVSNSKNQASDSGCSNGNCGTTSSSTRPGYTQHGTNTDQSSSTSNTQHTANSGITSEYPKPSTELESPKIHSLPSSYNVPIHGSYEYNEPKPSCDGNKCAQKGSHSTSNSLTSTNYLSPPAVASPSGSNCAEANCDTLYPENIGANVELNPQSHYGKPVDNTKLSNDDTLKYSGGFGGPAGLFKPNDFNAPSTTSASLHPHLSTSSLTKPSSAVGCTSSSCAPDANGKPGYQPAYTGGFGGPTGVLKPNEQDNYPNKPTSPPYNTHVPSSNVALTGCNSPNCDGYTPTAPAHTSPTQSLSTSKPINSASASKDDLPPYIGGFGGPSGILKPDEYDVHSQVPPRVPGHNSGACTTTNCSPSVHGPQTESLGVTKPIVGPHISSATSPSYTTHHNTFSGVNKVNDISSTITSSPSYTQSPISTGSYSSGCQSGDCGNYPTHTAPTSASGPSGPSSSINPSAHTGCASGNCNNYPSASASATSNLQSGSYNNGLPNADKYPQVPQSGYISGCTTGNCGDSPATGSSNIGKYPAASTECKTGNCDSYPSSSLPTSGNLPSGPYSNGSPNTGKYPQAPESGCKSGNCGDFSSTGSLNVGKFPSTTECKTGNCGNNYPTGNIPSSYNFPAESFGSSNAGKVPSDSTNIYPTGCTTGNCGVNPITTAPARPHVPSGTINVHPTNAGEYPSASANSYSPGCTTGNCNKQPTDNSHYGSHLPSGSFDVTATHADKHVSTPGYTTDCKTGNCNNYPTNGIQPVAVGSVSQAHSVSSTHLKPTSASNDNLPPYHGGFGGAPGLLKPNEYTVPVAGHKSSSSTPPKSSTCSTGNCDAQSPHGASIPHVTASGLHHGAVAISSADAVTYTGGFGGPPGFLKPYDDGKTGASLVSSKSHNGNSNGNTPNDAHSVGGTANHGGTLDHSGHLGGDVAGSTTFSAASASSGGYHNQGGSVKGSSPCGGGCGGGDSNGSHGHAGAAAKSLSGASSLGFGGSFASSSASAHASSGAYTKGGYGRR